jgi:hypothetical protein
MDARLAELLEALEADLIEMGRSEERRQMLMVRAVDKRWDADLDRFAARVDALAQWQQEEARRARRFRNDMAAWRLAVDERLAETPDVESPQEES